MDDGTAKVIAQHLEMIAKALIRIEQHLEKMLPQQSGKR